MTGPGYRAARSPAGSAAASAVSDGDIHTSPGDGIRGSPGGAATSRRMSGPSAPCSRVARPSSTAAGATGLAFFVYVLVNGGMISGLLPVVGVPMPLISYGGTSAVSLLAGFGLVMAVRSHNPVHGGYG